MKIGNTNVMPNGWGSSKKRKGVKIPKSDNEIFKLAVELGFKATGMNPHQVSRAKAFLKKNK